MNILVVIPARGGSKGLPGKNIKLLKGKHLINYSVELARSIFEDKDICVTTDSEEIKSVVERTGLKVPFIRPDFLSQDSSGTREVLIHAIDFYENDGRQIDFVLLLQPTSPLRSVQNINEVLALCTSEIDMIVSVKETRANPYYVLFEENNKGYLVNSKKGNFTRRQDCPVVWEYNGSIYLINTKSLKAKPISDFKRIKKYEMSELNSIDIDNYLDWDVAEMILSKKKVT